mmetsp:Transcript_117085/g.233329  ORF Transcript_117085/g.233329 Transcript_117085/m.233329 type:complete len:267 (-) Transcript_117085:853-1653(-)
MGKSSLPSESESDPSAASASACFRSISSSSRLLSSSILCLSSSIFFSISLFFLSRSSLAAWLGKPLFSRLPSPSAPSFLACSSASRCAFSARLFSICTCRSAARLAFSSCFKALASRRFRSSSSLRSVSIFSFAIRLSASRTAFSSARFLASSASSLVTCDKCRKTHCLRRSSVILRTSRNCWWTPSADSSATMLMRIFLPKALPMRFLLNAKTTGTSHSRAVSMRSSTQSSNPPSAVDASRFGAMIRHLTFPRVIDRRASRIPTQ